MRKKGRHFTHDHLGSVREVRDDAEDIEAAFEYTPYGGSYFAQEAAFGEDESDPGHVFRRFTGHHYDLRGGNYWTPFRAYSPTTARWLTPDPLGMVDGPNMYAYVGGNPVSFWDPLGLEIFLQSYQVKVVGLVPTGQQHTYVAIYPMDQKKWANHPAFSYDQGLSKWFTTLGAGPVDGNLVSKVGRDNKQAYFGGTQIDCDNENDLIDSLLAAEKNFRRNTSQTPLDYDAWGGEDPENRKWWWADTGYNSNAFTAGLLSSVGITPPNVAAGPAPGYDHPVPGNYFE